MPAAIDTSVLIAAERSGDLPQFLTEEDGPFYIPAIAAAEFLLGTHPPAKEVLRENARRFYDLSLRSMVEPFTEGDAARLALLNAQLRRTGKTMKLYDAAIAATVLSRGDKLVTADGDFDRVDGLALVKV